MGKKILLIGYNYSPEPTGIGKYSGEMIVWLAKRGYECVVITSYPYYPFWKVQEPYYKDRYKYQTEVNNFESGGSIVVCRCPMYIPAKPSGLKRIFLDLSFLITAFFKVIQLCFSREISTVIAVAPSFQFGLLGVLYKKFKNSKFIYHIHDMQIEAARDLNIIKQPGLIKFLLKIEKYIFDKADVITTISEQMLIKIQDKAEKKVALFPNWVDTSTFFPINNKELLKSKFDISAKDRIVLYSGGIGEKQGLEAILYAAKELADYPNLKFLICGSGPYKESLLALATSMNLTNVSFLPLQSTEKFNEFLNIADLHLVIQKSNASDLMMPSKLTTIMAVGGLALITANTGSGLYALVQRHGIGLLAEAENQVALNECIKKALDNDNNDIRLNARKYAEKYLFIDKIMIEFEKNLN